MNPELQIAAEQVILAIGYSEPADLFWINRLGEPQFMLNHIYLKLQLLFENGVSDC